MTTTTQKYICLHGHFYQPPRENPWLGEIELQESAYPYHDWNQRINAECYATNAAARILNSEQQIIAIVNNYAKISFNFGPTLLSWLATSAPDTYQAILAADKQSLSTFNGHGTALAQAYNHLILPLAPTRDKRLQIIWGIRDFQERFGRFPEGMWLPETAVDLETLDLMAEQGLRFTILAPHQARRFRPLGEQTWQTPDQTNPLDTTTPYLCCLPSGRTIALYFYNGQISHDLAFAQLLNSGEVFAERLLAAFSPTKPEPQLVHIATDGETYGHHHRFGEMALAYALHLLEKNPDVRLTNYGEFLSLNPPRLEVEIQPNTSWSCAHGLERWRSNCSCRIGSETPTAQKWRAPLRQALDWLRDNLNQLFDTQLHKWVTNSLPATEHYINVILQRTESQTKQFLQEFFPQAINSADQTQILKLLEMQRQLQLMYTSCGWFFDDLAGIETLQLLYYAARALQLAQEIDGTNLEAHFIALLAQAPSNHSEYTDGAQLYENIIKPAQMHILQFGIHFGVTALFKEYPAQIYQYQFDIKNLFSDRLTSPTQKLVIGQLSLTSRHTQETFHLSYAVFQFESQKIICGAVLNMDSSLFLTQYSQIKEAFQHHKITDLTQAIATHFGGACYSLYRLFKDAQREIMSYLFTDQLQHLEKNLAKLYEQLAPVALSASTLKMMLPDNCLKALEFIFNIRLSNLFKAATPDLTQLHKLAEEARLWQLKLDRQLLGHLAATQLSQQLAKWAEHPKEREQLTLLLTFFKITLQTLNLELNIWSAQNVYFDIEQKLFTEKKQRAAEQNTAAEQWLELFVDLGNFLRVQPPSL